MQKKEKELKTGMRVRVRTFADGVTPRHWVEDMLPFMGQIVTIRKEEEGFIKIEEDKKDWNWNPSDFKRITEESLPTKQDDIVLKYIASNSTIKVNQLDVSNWDIKIFFTSLKELKKMLTHNKFPVYYSHSGKVRILDYAKKTVYGYDLGNEEMKDIERLIQNEKQRKKVFKNG